MSGLPAFNSSSVMSSRDDAKLKQLEMISTRSKSGKMNDREMRDVANQFENMIFRLLIKEMRKTIPDNGFIQKSHAMKMYQEIADDYMIEDLTRSNDLGIEGLIYAELKEANKNIVDLDEIEPRDANFIPLKGKEQEAGEITKDQFIPLHQPHTDLIEIQQPKNWIDIPIKENGFVPLNGHSRLSSSKIDNLK